MSDGPTMRVTDLRLFRRLEASAPKTGSQHGRVYQKWKNIHSCKKMANAASPDRKKLQSFCGQDCSRLRSGLQSFAARTGPDYNSGLRNVLKDSALTTIFPTQKQYGNQPYAKSWMFLHKLSFLLPFLGIAHALFFVIFRYIAAVPRN